MPDIITEYVQIRCSGCGAPIALTFADPQKRSKMFCTVECLIDYAQEPLEERNEIWRMMVDRGVSPVRVAALWGVQHSLVYKTVKR
jgi:hypothetical protein